MKSVLYPVANSRPTLIDEDTAKRLNGKKLWLSEGYPNFIINRKNIRLHRFVMNAKEGQVIDHINGNKLDNRKINLRFVNSSLNCINRYHKIKTTHGFRGVSKDRIYRIGFVLSGKRIRLRVRNPVIGALLFDGIMRRHFQYPGRLNFNRIIRRKNVRASIEKSNGSFITVWFVKRTNGLIRKINCRVGVKRHSKNASNKKDTGLLFEPCDYDLISVYDVKNNCYRFIPCERVLCFKLNKKRYAVIP